MKLLIYLSLLNLFQIFLCDEEDVVFSNDSLNCGGSFTGFQYPIISPNYPKNYPDDQDCVYILKASQFAKCDQEFHLQFIDFQLEASKGCNKDYVKVGSGSIYCGNSIGIRKFKGQDKSLKLIFHSDGNTTARGFRILVTTLPCVVDSDSNQNENTSVSLLKSDLLEETPTTTKKENVKNSYPVFRPEIEFNAEEERGDQPPSRLKTQIYSPKYPSENLELPGYKQHNFHDENCGHSYSPNDDGIGSITSYLYLPPGPSIRPLKISGAKTLAHSNSDPNISSRTIPSEVVIKHFEKELHVTEPPANLIIPSDQIPAPFEGHQLLHKTIKNTFRHPWKNPQNSSPFYQPIDGWLTYGIPNSVPQSNPTIPNNGFDPLAINNNNNYNPGVNYNPVSPNCAGNKNNNNDNKNNNPNYYPSNNNNGNWNPNYNTREEDYSPDSQNVNVNYPKNNFGNGNGYVDTGNNDFDLSFVVNGNNPGYFVTNGNYYPNNNFYSPVDTTTYYGSGLSECCGTTYSSNSFLLTNPGFPALIYSSSNYECQYTIRRSSENICQLQMYLKFFNFGSDDQFCAYGYVEIDGTRVCGCKAGANITSYFDNIATKTITVKYLGYPRNKFSGFVIEVTQVSCSTSYLRFRNDQQHQNPIFIRNYNRNFKRSVTEEENVSKFRVKKDTEYFYQTPNSAGIKTSENFQLLNSCRIFKFLNWVKAAKQIYLKSAQCSRGTTTTTSTNGISSTISVIPIFLDNGNAAIINYPTSSNCESVNLVDGTISSLYYPNSYSNNLNQCYRFYKAPGYCQLELVMLDFDLENSTFCRKDYVSFSGQKRRYCGTSLAGSRTIIDMTQATFADLYFVTDSSGTGRGFRAGFTQISC